MVTSERLRRTIESCQKCPRLSQHQNAVKLLHPDYHCAPVGPWGVARPRLLIVGLAPGLHGAGRTGKGFVGDASGAFLFSSLHEYGFSSSSDPEKARLQGAVVTNIVKCLPPKTVLRASKSASVRDILGRSSRNFPQAGKPSRGWFFVLVGTRTNPL